MVDLYIEDSIRKNFLMKTFFLFGRKEVKGLLPNMHSDHRDVYKRQTPLFTFSWTKFISWMFHDMCLNFVLVHQRYV